MIDAFTYLKNERGLTDSTIEKFGLSWCDPSGEIYTWASFEGQFPKLDNRFHHSTLFPIHDLFGNLIAVSSRPLFQDKNKPKYCNTVYEKKDHLYGLFQNWKYCLEAQKVYVVEGNISMLMPWQCGLKNVVAKLGSVFSFNQLCLLSRFVKQIVFVSDNDKAGNNSILKLKQEIIPQKFYDADIKFSYIQLPQGMDPDDYFKKYSLNDFLALGEKDL